MHRVLEKLHIRSKPSVKITEHVAFATITLQGVRFASFQALWYILAS